MGTRWEILFRWILFQTLTKIVLGDERTTLEAFFDQTDGPSWKNKSGWKTKSDYCTWFGVSCEPLRILLPDNNVKYTVPSDLFRIVDVLDLSGNPIERVEFGKAGVTTTIHFQNTFIQDIKGVSQLKNLRDLRYSTVIPPVAHPFPEEVCDLTSLEILHLDNNRITGTLPTCIEGWRDIEELYLYSNRMTGTLPIEIGKLYNLRRLSLADNGWKGTIPEELANLHNLELLNLKGGRMSQKLTGKLPSFAMAASLHHLFVDNNKLTGSIPGNFLQHNMNLDTLVTVHLEHNELTGTLPSSLGRFQVMNLELIGNQIQGPVPESYCVNRRWMNGDVGEIGCDAILCGPGKYSRTGQGPCDLCDGSTDGSIGNNDCKGPSVTENLLSNPSILASQQVRILAEVYLVMDGRRRWAKRWAPLGEVLMTIPDYDISPTAELDQLDLSSVDPCRLEGIACNQQGMVEIIELTHNNMVGSIPSVLFTLPFLYILDLSYNRIEVDFSDLRQSRKLNRLRLSHTAQKSLVDIEKGLYLQELHLDGCDFGGNSIPGDFYSLTNLRTLHLEASFLGGKLSPDMRHLIQLRRLQLNENAISGTIPKEIATLNQLEYLDLSDNHLEGMIVTPICVLDISPGLCVGQIPTEVGHMSNLMTLKINRQRGLGGTLQKFDRLTKVQELELSSNSFSGTIPDDFLIGVNVEGKVTVRLGNNKLEGIIPESLSRFSNLLIEIEDNRIKGIPRELCSKVHWMEGEVGLVVSPCDAILCPIGYWSPSGRASSRRGVECLPCEGNAFFGETVCETNGLESNIEVEILNRLFEETGGLYWNASHTNWTKQGVPICYREGVLCGWKPADMNSGVTELILNEYGLRGRIPTEIYRLPKIRRLSFASNPVDLSFDGIQHAEVLEIVNLANTDVESLEGIDAASDLLHDVNVQGSQLKGTFPSGLLRISSLRSLHLDDNRLSGSIPTEIELLSNLEYVGFARNDFIGPIPTEVGALVNLKRFDVSENRMSGFLPTELGKLISLEGISIADQRSDNKFFGSMHPFAFNSELIFVNASRNEFSGPVPLDMLRSANREASIHIDLSQNRLTGAFPVEWSDRFLRLFVDLTGNEITNLATAVCDHIEWMNGMTALVPENHKCDAVLCAPGTFALHGRQKHINEPCRKCSSISEAPFYGSTVCLDRTTKQERQVLVEFAKKTGLESWYKHTNWLSDRHVCSWFGVTCDSLSRVSQLNLEDNGLAVDAAYISDIVAQLSALPSLKRLVLDNNDLSSIDLREVSSKSGLETLSLSGVGLKSLEGVSRLARLRRLEATGNNLKGKLPAELFKLSLLEGLDLSSNYFTGSIPGAIRFLTRLQTFALASNRLSGTLPSELGLVTELRYLDLKKQRGSDSIHGALPSFTTSTSLRYIDLSGNSFSGTIPVDFLAQSKMKTTEIHVLLQDNRVSGGIPLSLGSFDELDLRLANNEITEIPEQLCKKSDWLGGSVGLVGSCDAILCPAGYFSRDGRKTSGDQPCARCATNKVSPFMGRTSCEEVSERQILQRIFSSCGDSWVEKDNWMSDDPICSWYGVTCGGERKDESGVVALNLALNNLVGTLPQEAFLLPSLMDLNVSGNTALHVEFPSSLATKSVLETIDLCNTTVRRLDGIGQAPNLRSLRSSGLYGTFPEELFQLSKLESLDLSYSFLVGTLPSRIGDLTSLKTLKLHGNDLHSSIPSEIARISALEVLDLSENLFSGTLPTEAISSLQNLKSISLSRRKKSGRKLFGPLPLFSRAPKLEHVALDGNLFDGTVPDDFLAASFDINAIDLSRNRLVGTVPAVLSSQNGIDISIEGNQFDGTITKSSSERDILLDFFASCGGSSWAQSNFWGSNVDHCEWHGVGCSNSAVIVLNMQSNNLSGTLPSKLFELQRLQKLWLSDNRDLKMNFKGIERAEQLVDVQISNCTVKHLGGIGLARTLTVLNVSANQLTGRFPEELFSLENLRVLVLSKNSLSGNLPSTFGRLRYLRTLELSDNKFVGPLPSFSDSTTLSRIDLSNNKLEGQIPRNLLDGAPAGLPTGFIELAFQRNQLTGPLPDELSRFERLKIDISQNRIDKIPEQVCRRSWNYEDVEKYGCDAIACAPGTTNKLGRKSSEAPQCMRCRKAAPFFGQTDCSAAILNGKLLVWLLVSASAFAPFGL